MAGCPSCKKENVKLEKKGNTDISQSKPTPAQTAKRNSENITTRTENTVSLSNSKREKATSKPNVSTCKDPACAE